MKRIHFHTNFDLRYYDYCVEHIADVHNNLSNRSIGGAVPLQLLTGVTPDISAFRIPFWKHCWYWDPHIKWPRHQWCKGRCLGRAKNVGDPFTYWILPDHDGKGRRSRPLARSVVRPIMNEDEPPPCRNDMVDVPKVDFLHPDGRISFEASSLPTVVEEDDADIQNEIDSDESNDPALVVPREATTHPDPVAHVDLSHIKELQSLETAYIDEKSPEFDDIVSQLEQDVESSLLADIMPEPVPVSNSPDGQGDFNDSTLSLPSVTQDSEDEPDSLAENEADVS